MTQDKPIAVEHSQEEATSQVLPDANRLYSCKTALTGMYLEYHYSPPHETPEHYPNQHVIAIQTEGAVQSERRLDGQFRVALAAHLMRYYAAEKRTLQISTNIPQASI